jgi:thiol-disulfide isomerase/thioredoxin
MTPKSCLVAALVLIAIVVSLCGFILFFFRVLLPMIPERIVPNPESYRGVGKPLTFLELEPLTGKPSRLTLPDLEDHVVLMDFWGTWCPPCRAELPHFAALRERFAGQEAFQLVAISYPAFGQGDDAQSLRENTTALLKELKLDLPTYWDPGGTTLSAVDQLIGFEGFPTTILFDRHGVIRAIWVGYRPGVETEIERYVDKVLSEEEMKGAGRSSDSLR